MKLRWWHFAVFLLALVGFGIALAPASLIAPRQGEFSYERAEGTVWNGSLSGLQAGPYAVNRANWTLSFLDVVQGKAIVPVTFEGGAIEGRLMLLGNWHGDRRVAAQNLRVNGLRAGSLVLPGQTSFYDVDVLFEDGACVRAQGRIVSDVFRQAGSVLGWSGPDLEGRPRCEGDDAIVLLTGANELGERVNLRMVLAGDGAAAWRISVVTERQETISALNAAGFERGASDGALGYGEDTRWLP
nr:type II secretion system protein N [Nitrosomonas nitrosa]